MGVVENNRRMRRTFPQRHDEIHPAMCLLQLHDGCPVSHVAAGLGCVVPPEGDDTGPAGAEGVDVEIKVDSVVGTPAGDCVYEFVSFYGNFFRS